MLAAVNDACAATEGLAEAMASTLASATRELQQQAQEGAGLGATGGALPGSALAVVSHLLREPLTLLTACMQVGCDRRRSGLRVSSHNGLNCYLGALVASTWYSAAFTSTDR